MRMPHEVITRINNNSERDQLTVRVLLTRIYGLGLYAFYKLYRLKLLAPLWIEVEMSRYFKAEELWKIYLIWIQVDIQKNDIYICPLKLKADI